MVYKITCGIWYMQIQNGSGCVEYRELISPSLKELFVREIEGMILSGQIKAGEKLPTERELATRMRVSRAVINGGVSELAAKGFLEVIPRKGTFVADFKYRGRIDTLIAILNYNSGRFDPKMLDSIIEVRYCFEPRIAALAAQNRGPDDLDKLRGQMEKIRRLERTEALAAETHGFYHTLSVASGNGIYPLLINAFEPIYKALLAAVYRLGLHDSRMRLMDELMQAIVRGEAERAASRTTDIILWSKDILDKNYSPGQLF